MLPRSYDAEVGMCAEVADCVRMLNIDYLMIMYIQFVYVVSLKRRMCD
jgi:hypothetical protein